MCWASRRSDKIKYSADIWADVIFAKANLHINGWGWVGMGWDERAQQPSEPPRLRAGATLRSGFAPRLHHFTIYEGSHVGRPLTIDFPLTNLQLKLKFSNSRFSHFSTFFSVKWNKSVILRIFQRRGLKLDNNLLFSGLVQHMCIYRMAKCKEIRPFRCAFIDFKVGENAWALTAAPKNIAHYDW